ncbi:hypothetical protein GNY06_11710 [Elizabethkingia argentiflava]|uniref:DUF5689 domain-containing protein n=1 Tax=Elizabethkingia argenteiflava TaxID=2681556 RepID=A0A845PVZ8_9FLAO|nr:DUF5689 domain-containing protein [Elizabethkingia argenteiflava]NAW52004.1 hypothetical protein [Elizabethkingia argenteiflava]
MMNKIYFKAVFIIAFLGVLFSCVKSDDFEVPPLQCVDNLPATNHTLSDIHSLAKKKPTHNDLVKEDFVVEAYVSSSDESGNIYGALYVQDKPENPTQGIEIGIGEANQYGNFPVGSKIRINLKGLLVQKLNNNIKVGTYDPKYDVGRISSNKLNNYIVRACGENQTPIVAKIVPLEFNTIAEAVRNGQHTNQLIKIKHVQFDQDELGKRFADTDKRVSSRYLTDSKSDKLELRFSSYASFSTTPISPTYAKSGSIVLILSRYTNPYNSRVTEQAYLRKLSDIEFTSARFSPGIPKEPSGTASLLFKGSDFENWQDFVASLNRFGLQPYARLARDRGYKGGNALLIQGTPTQNDYVFTALHNQDLPKKPKRITLYIKGVSKGKSLSFNIYKEDGHSYAYNLGEFKTGAILDPSPTTNAYTGSIDTGGQWRLVELSLEGITDLNKIPNKNIFALKVGNKATYDILIDQIKIE